MRSELEAARAFLRNHFGPTPLVRAASMASPGRDVFLKVETGLPTGTFKVRGALYALSLNASRRRIDEVIAASTGNHGAAVAYAGKLLGIPATIFLPERPNPVKVDRIREHGARIVEYGTDLSAAIDAAEAYSGEAASSRLFLGDATDSDIPMGPATIGAEIVEQCPAVEAIYVPMGDTALIRGLAAAATLAKPGVRIIGVAAKDAPVYVHAWHSGRALETSSADTIADGLAVRRALAPNVDAIRRLVDDVRVVSDEEMLDAMAWLLAREEMAAEPAGAAATAAFLREQERFVTAVVLVTGRNVSPDVAEQVERRLPR